VVNIPATLPAASLVAASALTPVAAAPAVTRGDAVLSVVRARATIEEDAVLRTLRGYALAYEALDVGAAATVWPSVDRRALSRAFSGLKSQQVDIEDCEVRVDDTTATARCRGTFEYVPKVGRATPRAGGREWMFRMQKLGTEWKIDDVDAQQMSSQAAAPIRKL
jgi:hypothetical protein